MEDVGRTSHKENKILEVFSFLKKILFAYLSYNCFAILSDVFVQSQGWEEIGISPYWLAQCGQLKKGGEGDAGGRGQAVSKLAFSHTTGSKSWHFMHCLET